MSSPQKRHLLLPLTISGEIHRNGYKLSSIRKENILEFSKVVDSNQLRKRIGEDFNFLSEYVDLMKDNTLFLSEKNESIVTESIVQPAILSIFDDEIVEKIIKPILIMLITIVIHL